MRPEFEQQLHEYSSIAKNAIEARSHASENRELAQQELADLSEQLNESIENALQRRRSNEEAQTKIFSLQIQKQQIMDRLHNELSKLDEDSEVNVSASEAPRVNWMNGQLGVIDESGKTQAITIGELMTDLEWGQNYAIHNREIPRNIRKQYLIESAKYELTSLMNEQILRDELSDRWVDTGKEKAYKALLEERHSIPRFGHIAEVMVKNYIAKLGYDNGFEVEIELGDVYQDVEYKIDFIINIHDHRRGVGVEQVDQIERVAVQFTINSDHEVKEHKQAQVDRSKKRLVKSGQVDDMALVQLGSGVSREMRYAYDMWQHNQNKIGGPDKLLPMQTKRDIFMAIFANIYIPDELEDMWQDILISTRGNSD